MIPLATVVVNLIQSTGQTALFLVLGISTLAFFSTYFLYFKEANQKFADRTISNAELPEELLKWDKWHWVRIVFEVIAFLSALIILLIK